MISQARHIQPAQDLSDLRILPRSAFGEMGFSILPFKRSSNSSCHITRLQTLLV
jgi:hypothetical protein